ncbi:alpha/beta hydrolase [Mesorhizobium sp. M1322]|uniref:alpha/beta fold hydrolase n=1 Tax=Mesorhizobium sp. M1322 TaxID=2957081 RepID=UPI0033351B34
MAGVLDALKIDRADLVTHDIGNMVGYAFAIQHPGRTTRFVLIDAPVPGVGPWEEVLKNPLLWHFRFGGPDMERLVAGRERIYLDRFWNEFPPPPAVSPRPRASTTPSCTLYLAQCIRVSRNLQHLIRMRSTTRNSSPLRASSPCRLAIGGEKSFGSMMATIMRFAASDVTEGMVPNSGHWIMEENPEATIAIVRDFLASK